MVCGIYFCSHTSFNSIHLAQLLKHLLPPVPAPLPSRLACTHTMYYVKPSDSLRPSFLFSRHPRSHLLKAVQHATLTLLKPYPT